MRAMKENDDNFIKVELATKILIICPKKNIIHDYGSCVCILLDKEDNNNVDE